MVGFIEAEDDIVLVRHEIVDIVMPGPVVLYISPDHRNEVLVRRSGTAGVGAGAVILYREHLVVRSDVPVVPPADTRHLMIARD